MKATESTRSGWPSHFPPNCPPPEAKEEERVGYRLAASNPPAPRDFMSHYELAPGRKWHGFERCLACGISLFRSEAELRSAWELLPALRKKNCSMIAMGKISPASGKVMDTDSRSPGHFTWWVRVGFHPHTMFQVIGTV